MSHLRFIAALLSLTPLSSALLIVLYSLCLLLLRNLYRTFSPGNCPFWVQVILLLDRTIEYPLIFTFHPTILSYSYRHQHPRFPSAAELLAQIAVFFAIELLFQNCVLRFIYIPNLDEPNISTKSKAIAGPLQQQDPLEGERQVNDRENNELARRLIMDFVRPRGTLLLAIALLGMPSMELARWTGRLHPIAMVYWVALQQIVER